MNKDEYITTIIEFNGSYGHTNVSAYINSTHLEGYDLHSSNMTHEPLTEHYSVLLIFKLRKLASVIYGE